MSDFYSEPMHGGATYTASQGMRFIQDRPRRTLSQATNRKFAGQWVLLTDDYEVIDAGLNPGALMTRHPEIVTPFIMYLAPEGPPRLHTH
jgi:hypothetical protein